MAVPAATPGPAGLAVPAVTVVTPESMPLMAGPAVRVGKRGSPVAVRRARPGRRWRPVMAVPAVRAVTVGPGVSAVTAVLVGVMAAAAEMVGTPGSAARVAPERPAGLGSLVVMVEPVARAVTPGPVVRAVRAARTAAMVATAATLEPLRPVVWVVTVGPAGAPPTP